MIHLTYIGLIALTAAFSWSTASRFRNLREFAAGYAYRMEDERRIAKNRESVLRQVSSNARLAELIEQTERH